jgi:hypothetical protein
MHVELVKIIIRSLTMTVALPIPAVAVALLANQVMTIAVHLHRSGRLNRKVVRKVLQVHGFPIPPHRAFLVAAFPLLSLEVAAMRQAIELARRAAGSALTAEVIETFLAVWEALRGAYEDALADRGTPVDYVPRRPRQRYPGTQRVTVQQGESLSLITLREWDDALLWPLLYDANRETIGSDHNLIRAGMQLVLPNIANLPQTDIDRARERGRNWH